MPCIVGIYILGGIEEINTYAPPSSKTRCTSFNISVALCTASFAAFSPPVAPPDNIASIVPLSITHLKKLAAYSKERASIVAYCTFVFLCLHVLITASE